MKGSGVPRMTVAKAAEKASQPNILRTIHLPNEKVGKIRAETDRLNDQIQEQRSKFEAVILRCRDEKGAFEEQMRENYIKNRETLEETLTKVQDLETFNQQIVRDHVDFLAQHELNERRK